MKTELHNIRMLRRVLLFYRSLQVKKRGVANWRQNGRSYLPPTPRKAHLIKRVGLFWRPKNDRGLVVSGLKEYE